MRAAIKPIVCTDKKILDISGLEQSQCKSNVENSFEYCWSHVLALVPELDTLDQKTGRPIVELSDEAFYNLLEISLRCVQSRVILEKDEREIESGPVPANDASQPQETVQSAVETYHADIPSLLNEVDVQLARSSKSIEALFSAFQDSEYTFVGSIDAESVLIREPQGEDSVERISYADDSVFPRLMAAAEVDLVTYYEGSIILYSQRIYRRENTVFKLWYILDDVAEVPNCSGAEYGFSDGICEIESTYRWHTMIRWVPQE
ncbi:MAG: hypothetical protein QNJ05_00190 [Woeseiaceae bacterium]|nr:hypothetical protein [Woeseiaceae bacterium]